jgi:glutathione S-transferase
VAYDVGMKLIYGLGMCSLATHIALREAGIEPELVRFDRKTGLAGGQQPLEALNDKGLVPVLELDDGQRLTEVAAVLQYIADQAPERGLAPAWGTLARYRLIEWLNFLATEVHKAYWPIFHDGADVEKDGARERLARRFAWVEQKLGEGPFLMGETFTVADAYLFTLLGWARAGGIDLAAWPALVAYRARVKERPSVTAAFEAERLDGGGDGGRGGARPARAGGRRGSGEAREAVPRTAAHGTRPWGSRDRR